MYYLINIKNKRIKYYYRNSNKIIINNIFILIKKILFFTIFT